jgi:glutamate racemase
LRHVRARLPHEDIVYFADQAHVPYGERSEDDLAGLLAQNVAYLESVGVDAVVMGCNTSCAVAARRGWPPSRIPILDLIEAAAADVVARTSARSIGIVATTATARSGAYGDAIRRRAPGAAVYEVAAPALVPLVEAGKLSGPEPDRAVAEACAPLPAGLEAVVLACTHYPLLDESFARALGAAIVRLDPAVAQAERAVTFVRERGASGDTGHTRYVTTGPVEPYRTAIEAIVGPLGANDRVVHAPLRLAPTGRTAK